MRSLAVVGKVTLGVIVGALLLLQIAMWPERGKIERGAAQITAIERRLEPNTSRSDISRWLSEPQFSELRIEGGRNVMVVASPGAGNAENWLLELRFEGERIRASRIGTRDSLEEHPDGAPPARTYAPKS